ncbi:MAG: hypothetical protein RBU37_27435, partial [Myxococcota bacterium]|nr:hypothetical protein [Myxococcota bacterium]
MLLVALFVLSAVACMAERDSSPSPEPSEGSRIYPIHSEGKRCCTLKRRGATWLLVDEQGRVLAKASARDARRRV